MMQQSYNENVLLTMLSTLAQYPILSEKIIASMYNRLVQDGYISVNAFEEKVRDFALLSQKREGLQNPFAQEAQSTWEKRLRLIHQNLVVQSFAEHYSLEDFGLIVSRVVQNRAEKEMPSVLWHNMQHATIDIIIEQSLSIERMPLEEQKKYSAELMGMKVSLIRRLLSESPDYIDIAKKVFTTQDLIEINRLRIGRGTVGSKAAGVFLSNRILHNSADADIRNAVGKIESICIGSEEQYHFMLINNLVHWYDLKYAADEVVWESYPKLQEEFSKGEFPPEIVEPLKRTLKEFRGCHFMVRSSSSLEDSFARPFNSLYEQSFLPNQGTEEENLEALLNAIRRIYASTYNPNALIYRRKNGLQDFVEKAGILIQILPGNEFGKYFFTDISGVASSVSPFTWKEEGKPDEGFMRFSVGLSQRTSDRCGDDFVNTVIFSDPNQRHASFTNNEEWYSQQSIQVLNLKTNQPEILDIHDVIDSAYAPYFLLAQKVEGDTISSLQRWENADRCLVNCRELIKKTDFTHLMRDILHMLELRIKKPVMIQFSAMIDASDPRNVGFRIQINNCRPVTFPDQMVLPYMIPEVSVKRDLFSSDLYTENGLLTDIRYVVFVDPERYRRLFGKEKEEFCACISEVNKRMAKESFIFAAAVRWGARENHGLPVNYQDISNAKALVELSGWNSNWISDSFAGTQFFQTILEAGIYSVITNADRPEDIDHSFFTDSPDLADQWIDLPEKFRGMLRVLSTQGWYGSSSLMIEMNASEGITRAQFV